MHDNPDRVEAFTREIAAMGIRTPQAERERWALVGGVVAMAVGLFAIIAGWYGASGTSVVVEAISYAISGGALGLGLIVVGAALFVRYSSTRYLRYWLVRLIYEEQANADRIAAAAGEVRQAVERLRPARPVAASPKAGGGGPGPAGGAPS